MGGRIGQPTILNTSTIAGVCNAIQKIGWPKLLRFIKILGVGKGIRPCDAKRKKMGSSGQLFLACWQQSIPNFSLWHHEFIKAAMSAALVVLNYNTMHITLHKSIQYSYICTYVCTLQSCESPRHDPTNVTPLSR